MPKVSIGNSRVMIGEPWGQQEIPRGLQHAYVYVEDVDVTFRLALQAGATPILEPGDRLLAGHRFELWHERPSTFPRAQVQDRFRPSHNL